jgi:hypothetical protein
MDSHPSRRERKAPDRENILLRFTKASKERKRKIGGILCRCV